MIKSLISWEDEVVRNPHLAVHVCDQVSGDASDGTIHLLGLVDFQFLRTSACC
jgi:hypothetical protein